MRNPIIIHGVMRHFAETRVNLLPERVHKYREQVTCMCERLVQHIIDNHGFGLVKMLYVGSVAKGTTLRTINDLDVAVYVQKNQILNDKRSMVCWIGDSLRKVYPQKYTCDFDTSSVAGLRL